MCSMINFWYQNPFKTQFSVSSTENPITSKRKKQNILKFTYWPIFLRISQIPSSGQTKQRVTWVVIQPYFLNDWNVSKQIYWHLFLWYTVLWHSKLIDLHTSICSLIEDVTCKAKHPCQTDSPKVPNDRLQLLYELCANVSSDLKFSPLFTSVC